MNKATKAALITSQLTPFHLNKTAPFHSTPVLDRRRRTHWDSGGSAYRGSSRSSNYHSKRFRRLNTKQSVLHNVSAFADHLFQSWQYDRDEYYPSSSQGSSWFRMDYQARGSKGGGTNNKGPQAWGRRSFDIFEDNVDVETIFRSAFGGNGYFYWSYINEEPQRSSSEYSNYYRTSWRQQNEEDYDSSTESDSSESDLASDRLALGLSASGPLKMVDVKNAYRTCALKWHPDRHQGSTKAVAEAKFKVCSAAYQSLCDKLALN